MASRNYHNSTRELKIDPHTFGYTNAAVNLADMLRVKNDKWICRKVSDHLHSHAGKIKAIVECDAPIWLKRWALDKAREDFKQVMDNFPKRDEFEIKVSNHLNNVGKAYITDAMEEILQYNFKEK